MTTHLMAIEADRQIIDEAPFDVQMLASLRQTARLMNTHYSTQIEGNRLTQAQVQQVLAGGRFPGRQRDETEVLYYYRALEKVETLAQSATPLTEVEIQHLHALVATGQDQASPYRSGQNVITNSENGAIVYLPPEAPDVPALMADLVTWIGEQMTARQLPMPLVAGMTHYQFATIHPYYDGNGRTARLLTTLLLQRTGYGLKGLYSLEEYYARNLSGYYRALEVGTSHNYYFGRKEADITGFLSYFCAGMAEAFGKVRQQADLAQQRAMEHPRLEVRHLGPRERMLLDLFYHQPTATAREIAAHLGISTRTVQDLCRDWLNSGFLVLQNAARKNRAYRLAPDYEKLIG